MKSIIELKNKHQGDDIYILASGKSVDFFNEDFFDNKIVILDEPISAIDKDNITNIIDAIKELGKNKTVIIITHNESILSIVNRVIKLNSGKIIEDNYI